MPRKCILKQVLSEGSTAQNAQKVLKIEKITKIMKKHNCPQGGREQNHKNRSKIVKNANFHFFSVDGELFL